MSQEPRLADNNGDNGCGKPIEVGRLWYRRTARATRKGKDERKTETGGGLAAIEKDQPMTTYSAMTRFLFFFHVE